MPHTLPEIPPVFARRKPAAKAIAPLPALTILAAAFVATPLVVFAAGGPTPAPASTLTVAAPAPAPTAPAAVETPATRQAACVRKVRVVYPGYQPPEEPACPTLN